MKITSLSTSLLLALALPAAAAINIPSDGSDGALSPVADLVIDLSQAVPGTWSDNNTGADIGKGIYDATQWAIVFEYSSVNIPPGVTVSFANHPSKAPVIWLVSGDVTIDGTLSLKGGSVFSAGSGLESLVATPAGPGGFRGGPVGPEGRGRGLGPGGAETSGGDQIPVYRSGIFEYGNPQILPLIGGAGGASNSTTAGSGGGGAILIACRNNIQLEGHIDCSGGNTHVDFAVLRGAGGAVRLIAEQVSGTGTLDCRGGFWDKDSPEDTTFEQGRSEGRIRVETVSFSPTITMFPETVAVAPADPPLLFPPANAPSVRIISVDALLAPADPTAPLQATSDVAIQNNGSVKIVLQTENFPIEGVVQVRVAEKFGNAQWVNATNTAGDINSASWEVFHTFDDGFTTLQARATAP